MSFRVCLPAMVARLWKSCGDIGECEKVGIPRVGFCRRNSSANNCPICVQHDRWLGRRANRWLGRRSSCGSVGLCGRRRGANAVRRLVSPREGARCYVVAVQNHLRQPL